MNTREENRIEKLLNNGFLPHHTTDTEERGKGTQSAITARATQARQLTLLDGAGWSREGGAENVEENGGLHGENNA